MAQLQHRLVDETESVQAPLGQLATVGVEWEIAVQRDAPTAIQPSLGLPEAAEAQGLEPRHAVERKAVVQQRNVDVLGPQISSAPQMRGLADDLGLVSERPLIPRDTFGHLRSDGVAAYGRSRQITADRRVGHHDRDRAVTGNVAIVEAER